MNIFTYGSLMFERVWTAVVTSTYRKTPAWLCGYQRRKIRGQAYPALIPGAAADQIDGVVYQNVGGHDVLRLDRFEGACYMKKKEICLLPDGGRIPAWAYVFREKFADLVEAQAWDPVWFENHGIDVFMRDYQGYRRIDAAADMLDA